MISLCALVYDNLLIYLKDNQNLSHICTHMYVHMSRFGLGTGPTWLDEVICDGSEYFIHLCQHNPFGSHDCTHREDAAVVCYRKSGSI